MTTNSQNSGSSNYGHESYRDYLTTVDDEGKRVWIFAKKPKGKWHLNRKFVGYGLLLFLFSAPFIKIKGHQMLLFDFVHRKFVLFGSVFWPHDFYIFLIGFLTFIVFIFLFTAIFGRLWCGWACPQTIFMELIFRKVEYMIEGDAPAQRKLSKMPWNTEKILKRGFKFLVFYIISFFIANIFLSYIVGSDALLAIMKDDPANHVKGLVAIGIFSFVFFFVYTYMREQVCTIICPYGRLQSVLMDDQSLIVAYDNKRGEPRAKWGRNRPAGSGDCISCAACIDVCPTGIDIRNGLQLECVNCTACIDACDDVMRKIEKPEGLIRYASLQGIEKNEPFRMTTRRILYSILLTLLIGVLVTILSVRSHVQTTLLRTPGMSYTETKEGRIMNIYNVKVLNKTFKPMEVQLKLESIDGIIDVVGNKNIIAPSEDYGEGIIRISIDKKLVTSLDMKLKIGVYSGNEKLQTINTAFMGPDPSL